MSFISCQESGVLYYRTETNKCLICEKFYPFISQYFRDKMLKNEGYSVSFPGSRFIGITTCKKMCNDGIVGIDFALLLDVGNQSLEI